MPNISCFSDARVTLLLLGTVALSTTQACDSTVDTEPAAASTTTSPTTSSSMGGTGGTGAGTSAGGNPSVGGSGAGGSTGGGPTTSSTGGTGGTGGSQCTTMNSGDDVCPGPVITIDGSIATQCFVGTTEGKSDDYSSMYCGPNQSNGAESVYQIVVAGTGSLVVQVRAAAGSTLDPTMHARANGECDTGTTYYGCWPFFATHEEFALHSGPDTFYLFIDGANGSSGAYELEIAFTPPACGDKTLNPGEICDDGNTNNNDGCSATCQLEIVTAFDKCPGESAGALLLNQPLVFTSSTTPYADNYRAIAGDKCAQQPPVGAKDRVYQFTAGANGTVTAAVGYDIPKQTDVCSELGLLDPGCWSRVLYAYGASPANPNSCEDTMAGLGPQLACSNETIFGVEEISFPVLAGKKYFVVIDGYSSGYKAYGPFNLHLSLTP